MPFLLHLKSLLALTVIATAALGLGGITAAGLGWRIGNRRLQLVGEATLGLVLAGTGLMVLGFAGQLNRPVILGFTFACGLAGMLRLRFDPRIEETEPEREPGSIDPRLTAIAVGHVAASAAVLSVLASLAVALAPPTAGDALCYHLELPKRFLQEQSLVFSPHDDNCTYPLLAEMWFAWALALDGPVAAQLTQWFCGVLLAGWTYLLAARILGQRGALAAAAVVLVAPGVNNQMTVALNDVAPALMSAAALVTWLDARKSAKLGPYLVVGLFVGGAIGVKYTALLFAAALAGVWLISIATDSLHRRSLVAGAVVAAAATLVVAAPWYVRAAVYRGDPVYPFLSKVEGAGAPSTFPESKTPLGRSVAAVALAPWSLTMEPERVGGRAHQFGPLFLMFVPCAIPLLRHREFRLAAIVAGIYGAACILLRQNIRFLLPCLPVAAAAVAYAWQSLQNWPTAPRRIAATAAVGLLLFLAAIPLARLRHVPAVAFGLESREDYLARVEPSFEPAAWINRNVPPEAHILSQEQRAFYIRQAVTRENIYRRNTAYAADVTGEMSLNTRLRFGGFTHVLLAEGIGPAEPSTDGSNIPRYDGTLTKLVDEAMAAAPDERPKPLAEWQTADAAGAVRRYRLLELR